MASNEPIERLTVRLEADVRDLLTDADRAISKLENRLGDVDKAGKKAGRFESLKNGLRSLGPILTQLTIAAGLFGAALASAVQMANQAIQEMRIERSFYRLAAAVGQSGQAIIQAMTEASNATIEDDQLMEQANRALQLGVARTPQEFERLVRSARALAQAVGMDTVPALNMLIESAGSGATRALRELGISVVDVNRIMERLSLEQFGVPSKELDATQRRLLLTQAILEAAAQAAEKLGGAGADVGDQFAQVSVQADNFKDELNKTALIMLTLLNSANQGPGILKKLAEGAVAWQNILIQVAALSMAINDTLSDIIGKGKRLSDLFKPGGTMQAVGELGISIGRRLLEGKPLFSEAGDEAGKSFSDRFTEHLNRLEEQFKDVLHPEDVAPGTILPPELPEDTEAAQAMQETADKLATEMLDAAQERTSALEELEADHNDRMAEITAEGAERRLEIDQDYQRDLEKLARDTEERRADIMRDTQRSLEELTRDTDQSLAEERDDFQDEERRETEDHLRDMRRLTEDYLLDLGDAVKERDARAVVDLQRRFAVESQRREEDFETRQGREREDHDERLAEIRQNEAERRQEILAAQAEQLADLIQDEARRRAEIERSHVEQLAKLDQDLATARAKEGADYAQRQATLNQALQARLATIAQGLADEETINAEHAQRLLEALNRTFGVGGDIDKLMEDFAARRRQRMRVEVFFEQAELPPGPGNLGAPYPGGPIMGMQSGGTLIARRPTTVMFGERGAEAATFIPLGRTLGDMPARRLEIVHSGSAPPGIRATERDQIAAVLLSALRETGALQE